MSAASFAILIAAAPAPAFNRVTGIDVSYRQGDLDQDDWDTIHDVDGKSFTFTWSKLASPNGASSLEEAAVPEPCGLLLALAVTALIPAARIRHRRES